MSEGSLFAASVTLKGSTDLNGKKSGYSRGTLASFAKCCSSIA